MKDESDGWLSTQASVHSHQARASDGGVSFVAYLFQGVSLRPAAFSPHGSAGPRAAAGMTHPSSFILSQEWAYAERTS
jgi:hypothetical protein